MSTLTEATALAMSLGTSGSLESIERRLGWYRDTLASATDAFDDMARVDSLLASVADAIGAAHGVSTHRTESLVARTRTTVGSVPVARTFGRGTETDDYELLQGAPVGCPESLASHRRELAAVASDIAWTLRNARAESGLASTRTERESTRRKRGGSAARRKAARHACTNCSDNGRLIDGGGNFVSCPTCTGGK